LRLSLSPLSTLPPLTLVSLPPSLSLSINQPTLFPSTRFFDLRASFKKRKKWLIADPKSPASSFIGVVARNVVEARDVNPSAGVARRSAAAKALAKRAAAAAAAKKNPYSRNSPFLKTKAALAAARIRCGTSEFDIFCLSNERTNETRIT